MGFKKIILLMSAVLMWTVISGCGNKPNTAGGEAELIKRQEAAEADFMKTIQKTRESDKDFDGLTDSEEKKQGTNPAESDTDKDGVLDGTELSWKINPLKADTDDDGMNDGDEIRRGQNPLGPGSLPAPKPKS